MEHVITHFKKIWRFLLMNKNAFTLAEVLITLGIIGVVAALTLPSVIEKHKEQVTVNKVKKFYSVMSQAILLAIKDNGYLDEWDVPDGQNEDSAKKFMEYLKPYLLISKDCGTSAGCLGYKDKLALPNGGNSYTNYDTNKSYYKVILNDGSYIWLRSAPEKYCKTLDYSINDACGLVFIDINGGKAPNTIAKDVFNFYIVKNGLAHVSSEYLNNVKQNHNAAGSYILLYGNMNYLK